jgi:hypothetical protein
LVRAPALLHWHTADKLRQNMPVAPVALIFLEQIHINLIHHKCNKALVVEVVEVVAVQVVLISQAQIHIN